MNANVTDSTVFISLSNTTSSIVILIWFEIIAACITYGLGFIGNLLSLIVFFSQEEFRNVSTGVLFLLMTISNTIHLWTLTTEFLTIFNIDIYSDIFVRCRLNYFIQNVSRSVSTYLAIGITLDRLIRSEFLIRSRTICTRRNVIKFSLICLFIYIILYSFWFCPLNTLNPLTGTCYAGQSSVYIYFLNNIFLPMRLILVCIIPVLIMSIANIRMIYNIRRAHQRVHDVVFVNRRMTPLDRMLFYMMLTSVGTFVITQIPFHIYTLVQAYYSVNDLMNHLLIRALLLIWSSVYFGIGFYLYCFASPRFRQKFFFIIQKIFNCIRRHY